MLDSVAGKGSVGLGVHIDLGVHITSFDLVVGAGQVSQGGRGTLNSAIKALGNAVGVAHASHGGRGTLNSAMKALAKFVGVHHAIDEAADNVAGLDVRLDRGRDGNSKSRAAEAGEQEGSD